MNILTCNETTNLDSCLHDGCCDFRGLGQVQGAAAMHVNNICDIHMYSDKSFDLGHLRS